MAAEPGQRRRSLHVLLLSVGLALAALALDLRLPGSAPHRTPPWELLTPAFVLAELLVVHVQVRRQSLSLSLGEVVAVTALVFAAPRDFVLACALGSIVGLSLQRRQGLLKFCFNLALFFLDASVVATVFDQLARGADPAATRSLLAAALAVQAGAQLSNLALSAVITLHTGHFDSKPLLGALGVRLLLDIVATSLGLLGVILWVQAPLGLVLLAAVIVLVLVVSRAYSRLDWRHRRVGALYEFTKAVTGIETLDGLAEVILRAARDTLHCEVAELVLSPSGNFPGLILRMQDTGVGALSEPSELGRLGLAGRLVHHLRGTATTEAISVPLATAEGVFGSLSVAERWTYLPAFGPEDLQLFCSLSDHAAVTLRGSLLLRRVSENAAEREYQALHDTITLLPNRRALIENATRWRALHGDDYAVLALDLFDFSNVNDTLGHASGDQLLHEVGRRLLWNSDTGHVARLGNDEFAVLLPGVTSAREAAVAAAVVLAPIAESFGLHGLRIDTRANAGVSIGRLHGGDPTTLVQRADVALAVAKRDDLELHVYDAADDLRGARRLQLVSDLRMAIAADALEVWFQPKLNPLTEIVQGAEALARWQHPTEGFVAPDEFIPLAEHAGLIRDLTRSVLRVALTECARWRREGHELTIAVNLSARTLGDATLASDVARELAASGLPAHALTLEITETAVMSDLSAARLVLEELRAMGVALSLDDYGTGHSSLSYLAGLPVTELKLDKSFTLGLPGEASALSIVRSTIALGHELGLCVVAEGVEEEGARALLSEWGCDVVQGYFYSRPLPAAGFDRWLSAHLSSSGAWARSI